MGDSSTSELNSTRIVRFGIFEVDLRTEELHKNGIRIKLSAQPVRVLAALIEKPREVVTWEQLRRRIWPSTIFVDFEEGLNRSVNSIGKLIHFREQAALASVIQGAPLRTDGHSDTFLNTCPKVLF